ncbi:ParA family protein [Rhodocytophaga aerolata]|uniref:ParA family protein n=1 Tax=Rhodocytophaga aerolata TaxID=455078 RepID=A0ABT8RBS0_9BACT|nr:ParA family protein [Rhodocytophaga aerolata]MDO1449541.1 ParA family protein [Rhodocytophaga aerolata]
MAKIISIVNHKGGVGKTTSSVNIAASLSLMGYKVLGVDMDPQAHFSILSSQIRDYGEEVVGNLMLKRRTFDQVVQKSTTYEFLPSSKEMTRLEKEISFSVSPVKALAHAFTKAKVSELYDFVIIDCPPALGTLTLNALNACQYVVSSFTPEPLTWAGFTDMFTTINAVAEYDNPTLKYAGVFFTKYHPNMRNREAHAIADVVRQTEGEQAFTTYIRSDLNLQKMLLQKRSVLEFAPESNAAIDYKNLTDELLEKIN